MVLKVDDILEEGESSKTQPKESPAELLPPKALPPLNFESTDQVSSQQEPPEPTSIDAIRGRTEQEQETPIALETTNESTRPQGTMELDLNDMVDEETPVSLDALDIADELEEEATSPEKPAAHQLLEKVAETTSPERPAALPLMQDNEPTQQIRLNPEMANAVRSAAPNTDVEPKEETTDLHTLDARPSELKDPTQEIVAPELSNPTHELDHEPEPDPEPDTKLQPVPTTSLPGIPQTAEEPPPPVEHVPRTTRRTRSSPNNPNPFASLLEEASQSQTELEQVPAASKPAPIPVVQKRKTAPVPVVKPPTVKKVHTFHLDDEAPAIPLQSQRPQRKASSPLDEEDIQVTVNDLVDMELDDNITFLDDETPSEPPSPPAPVAQVTISKDGESTSSPFPQAGMPGQRMVGFPSPQPIPVPKPKTPPPEQPQSMPQAPPSTEPTPTPVAQKVEAPPHQPAPTSVDNFPTAQESPEPSPSNDALQALPTTETTLEPKEAAALLNAETVQESDAALQELPTQDTEAQTPQPTVPPPFEAISPEPAAPSLPNALDAAQATTTDLPSNEAEAELQETLPLSSTTPAEALAETVPPLDIASAPTAIEPPKPVQRQQPPPPANTGIVVAVLCLGLGLILITLYFFFL